MYNRLVWLPVLALIFGPSLALGAEPDHAEHDHRMARILETRVSPKVIEIHSADAIGWVNYSNQRARISFDAEVAKNLTCRSKGTFHLDGPRLSSNDIQASQFASLCSLAPGEYEYRVELRSGAGGAGGSSLGKSFKGRIIVSE